MPFANARRLIPLGLDQLGQRPARGIQHAAFKRIDNPMKFAPVVSPVQERVAARGAYTRRTMRIGKSSSFSCEPIQMRSWDLRLAVLHTQVPVTHIIGIQQDYIRSPLVTQREGRSPGKKTDHRTKKHRWILGSIHFPTPVVAFVLPNHEHFRDQSLQAFHVFVDPVSRKSQTHASQGK